MRNFLLKINTCIQSYWKWPTATSTVLADENADSNTQKVAQYADAYTYLGGKHYTRGELDQAEDTLNEILAMHRKIDDKEGWLNYPVF